MKARITDTKHKFDENTEDFLNKRVLSEYDTCKSNLQGDMSDFESNLRLMENERDDKEYDWMSNIRFPEAASIMITESSQEATQAFGTRDFCDVYLEGSTPQDFLTCKSVKKLINAMLNNKRIYHYLKYMQARDLNRHAGYVYAICWWEQNIAQVQKGEKKYQKPQFDESGNVAINPETMTPLTQEVVEPIMDDMVLLDHFNWMPIDPRNVFINNKYVYSPQQEESIIIRSEQSYQDLKDKEKDNDYFNLDIIKEQIVKAEQETETSKESYNNDDKFQKNKNEIPKWDILARFGWQYCMVQKKDDNGYATEVTPGYNDDGTPKEGAELVRVRQETAYRGKTGILIRFQAEPLRDGNGIPYIPIVRGLCYPHPTKKIGMSSGKYLRELQTYVDDCLNAAADRTTMSTMPTMVVDKYDAEDNDELYYEPEHIIPLTKPDSFREVKISGDIQGSLSMYNLGKNSMQQIEAVYPNTMGSVGKSDITATAVQGADQRANVRANYKNLSWTFTFDTEFYWIILQMAWQFMHPKTAKQIFTKEEIMSFQPTGDYTYQPVTSTIEAEHSKNKKIQNYDQITGRLSGLAQGNPAIIPIIAYVVGQELELMGSEYRLIKPMIEKLMKTPMKEEGDQPNQIKDMKDTPTSNEQGIPQGSMEESARANG